MKIFRLLFVLMAFACCGHIAAAQNPYCPTGNAYLTPQTGGSPLCVPPVLQGFGPPSGACIQNSSYNQQDATPGANIWACVNGAWVQQAATGCPTTGCTMTGNFTALKIGPVFQADQFPGPDAATKINACYGAVYTAGGGTCDAGNLGGTSVQDQSEMIVWGSEAGVTNHINATLLLPQTATWAWGLTDGVSCGIEQIGSTRIIGSEIGGGAGHMFLETANSSTYMDSLYCTDPTPTESGSYIRASGFSTRDGNGGTLLNGMIHIQKIYDESNWSFIQSSSTTNDGWHVSNVCCGSSFDHIQGSGSGYQIFGAILPVLNATLNGTTAVSAPDANFNASYVGMTVIGTNIPSSTTVASVSSSTALVLSQAATGSATETLDFHPAGGTVASTGIAIRDATFNEYAAGVPNLIVSDANGISLDNIYMEGHNDTTTPFMYLDSSANGVSANKIKTTGSLSTKYSIESHIGPSSNSWSADSVWGAAGIDDVANGLIVSPFPSTPYGIVSFYSPSGPAIGLPPSPAALCMGPNGYLTSAACQTFPLNQIVDSAFANGNTYWTFGGFANTMAFSGSTIVIAGAGSPVNYQLATQVVTGLTANVTYSISGMIDATYASAGSPSVQAYSADCSTTLYASFPSATGTVSTYGGNFLLPSGQTSVCFRFNSENSTVASGHNLVFSQPQFNIGSTPNAYSLGSGQLPVSICSGSFSLGTPTIASGAASLVTQACTGLLTTDNIQLDFNADTNAVTGYAPSSSGMLTLKKYPTANTINVSIINNTASSITAGAVTVNYRVIR